METMAKIRCEVPGTHLLRGQLDAMSGHVQAAIEERREAELEDLEERWLRCKPFVPAGSPYNALGQRLMARELKPGDPGRLASYMAKHEKRQAKEARRKPVPVAPQPDPEPEPQPEPVEEKPKAAPYYHGLNRVNRAVSAKVLREFMNDADGMLDRLEEGAAEDGSSGVVTVALVRRGLDRLAAERGIEPKDGPPGA